ncbi:MAG: PEP/pyruvate-binding domain-containing protein [Kiritimatiellia bacterium]
MSRFKDTPSEVLAERAKELECLYAIDELLRGGAPDMLQKVAEIIPIGFRNVQACVAELFLDDQRYCTRAVDEHGDELRTDIVINNSVRGCIKVKYQKGALPSDDLEFLPQEAKLLDIIANIIADSIYKKQPQLSTHQAAEWESIIELLKNTDHEMLLHVCEKMLAILAKISPNLLVGVFNEMNWSKFNEHGEVNTPLEALPEIDVVYLSTVLLSAARNCLNDSKIYDYICLWIYQKKTSQLIKIVNKKSSDVKSVAKAIQQYKQAIAKNKVSSEPTKTWLTIELIRRFITHNPQAIAGIQKHITLDAFGELLDKFICSPMSCGTIGGKGTGFFLANQIIATEAERNPLFKNFKIPRTWYIASDELDNLIESNGFEELNEHKYRDILDIRINYPRIIQMLKSCKLSPYLLHQLDQILDECEETPLIVRSSSVLEDQLNSSFSGKYKSLFLANSGSKTARRTQLMESILEVYASVFNPDSIQYRRQRNLLHSVEQMGIMIQEVVGRRVGPYYFPLYAGVAFSHNELRWSPRIKREDGLLRMVMGLGTRAVDRVGDDYPILISPGQPNLAVNYTPSEIRKYSPQMIDLIDLEKRQFVTLPIATLIKTCGGKIPHVSQVASVIKDDIISDTHAITTDFKTEDVVVTLNGLIQKTPFIKQIQATLSLLSTALGYPVDIEFASDGEFFYLLQCRSQSQSRDCAPVPIPANIPSINTVFTAHKYISNGRVAGIKSVVYVDPVAYSQLESYEAIIAVASVINELNKTLPRRSFILMGPGRWGSRGDVKLGVPIVYSNINNTAMLIEIAQKASKHQPDLSFGTHFFQDLVEENIKYLPLYPDDDGVIFNRSFLHSTNSLARILPAYAHLQEVVKVIDIAENYFNKQLYVLMNAELERAVAYLDVPLLEDEITELSTIQERREEPGESGWKWRHFMAEQIAQRLDLDEYSIKGIYLFGSTNNCTAQHNSDIDLLIHFDGTADQKQRLDTWLNGWSMALSEINFLRTGYRSDGLLDIHYVTDEDIQNKDSFAMKINSPYDPASPLRFKFHNPLKSLFLLAAFLCFPF